MNSLRLMALLSLVLVATDAFTAQFTVKNAGSYRMWVKPFWGPGDAYLTELKPGESRKFDSGFYSVGGIHWVQEYPLAMGQTAGQLNVKVFNGGSLLSMNPLELAVTIDLLNEGSFKVQRMLQPAQTGTATTLNGF